LFGLRIYFGFEKRPDFQKYSDLKNVQILRSSGLKNVQISKVWIFFRKPKNHAETHKTKQKTKKLSRKTE
jgi:hypothetical protein